MKLKIILFIFLINIFGTSSDVLAVPFRELNQDLVKNCISCKYYSTLYDAISQGGYRIYTGLFNICMFFLFVTVAFQTLKNLFKIIVSDTTQLESNSIQNLDSFWKDIFKKMLRIVMVIIMVFTLKPQNITKWTIDPIVSGGITVARSFLNYGIKQINNNSIGNKHLVNKLLPSGFTPKISLGIITLPLNSIQDNIKQPEYCQNIGHMSNDAKKYEEDDNKNNLPHALPILTKLELMCLIQDVNSLSKRYAGLATYFMIYMFNSDKIEQVPNTNKNVNKVTITSLTKKDSTNLENNLNKNFSTENNIMDFILTSLFIIWLIGIGLTIYNIVKWFIPDPLISLIVAVAIPLILLITYFLFGGAVLFMTLAYYTSYLIFILVIPFYFIQPMFSIAIILFAIPLIATAWAIGDKSYLNNAINTVINSSIGIAVLCMLFVIAIMLNEITFYSLYDTTLSIYSNNSDINITQRLNLFNFLIMAITSVLSMYIISNHSKFTKLFGGSTSNEIFGFLKDFVTKSINKVTSVSKQILDTKKTEVEKQNN